MHKNILDEKLDSLKEIKSRRHIRPYPELSGLSTKRSTGCRFSKEIAWSVNESVGRTGVIAPGPSQNGLLD